MMGSGVRHLLGAISKGSSKIRPPMKMHKEWNCIFVQSNGDDDRQLQSGTTYLFC